MARDITKEQKKVNAQLEKAYDEINALKDEQRVITDELDHLLKDQHKYAIVSEMIEQLDKLKKMGGDELFWGEGYDPQKTQEHYNKVRADLNDYDSRVREIQDRRNAKADEIHELAVSIGGLNERTLVLEELAEEVKYEFQIEREMEELPYRPMIMPWSQQDEDQKRFRKILLIVLLVSFLLGFLIPMYDIPIPDREEIVEVPERFAKLIEKKPPPPKPKPKIQEKKEPEKKRPSKDVKKPKTEKQKVARKKAETAGLMAFKDNFSDLIDTDVDKKLGAQAQISNLGKKGKTVTRSIVTSAVGTGSVGIKTGNLSRNTGGAGKGIKGVAFSRVESAVGTDFFGEERPLSDGPGPSRTDEEIQIVFDRYKSALYRIYNRELRNNPTLQGKIVLRLTIEPDGTVSKCSAESSDMDSPALISKIVARVKKFNFGAKEGVPPTTILYPIDFLPAS